MSEPNTALTPRATLAAGFLILMFFAGLLLVYLVGPSTPPASLGPSASDSSPAVTDEATGAAASAAAEGDPPGKPGPELPAPAAGHLLAVTQQRLAALEEELEEWRRQQAAALETERQRVDAELARLAHAHRQQLEAAKEAGAGAMFAQLGRDYAALQARFTPDGILVSLAESDLEFARGRDTLVSERPASLMKLAEFLVVHPDLQVLLRGHTDSLGGETANLVLSEQRALAVKRLLVDLGVAEDRIRAEGMGETDPIADNRREQGRERNRRVEIYLTEG